MAGAEDRVENELQVGLYLERRGKLQGIECLQDVFVLMVNRPGGRRGLAPDETDSEQIGTQPRAQPGIVKRRLHHQPSADLGRGPGRHVGIAKAEPAEIAEWGVFAELLLEIETEAAPGRPISLG